MRVDETRNDDLAAHVDLALAAVFAHRADNAVVADRNVALDEFPANEIGIRPPFSTRSAWESPCPCSMARLRKAMASLMNRLRE